MRRRLLHGDVRARAHGASTPAHGRRDRPPRLLHEGRRGASPRPVAVSQQLSRLESELASRSSRGSSRSVGSPPRASSCSTTPARDLRGRRPARRARRDRRPAARRPAPRRHAADRPVRPLAIADFTAPPGVATTSSGPQDEMLARSAPTSSTRSSRVDPDVDDEFAATLLSRGVVCSCRSHARRAGHVTLQQLAGLDSYVRRLALGAARARDGRARLARATHCTAWRRPRARLQVRRGHPALGAEEPGPPIELRPIGPQPFTWPVALVWRARRRQPPAAKAFLALAIARADAADRDSARAPRRHEPAAYSAFSAQYSATWLAL